MINIVALTMEHQKGAYYTVNNTRGPLPMLMTAQPRSTPPTQLVLNDEKQLRIPTVVLGALRNDDKVSSVDGLLLAGDDSFTLTVGKYEVLINVVDLSSVTIPVSIVNERSWRL
jgi:hypothetical protein